jgi:hypothetical protein
VHGTNRSINGVDVSVDSTEAGSFRADWLAGGWAFGVTGNGFPDEEAFLGAVAGLRLASTDEFAAQTDTLQPILPGDDLGALVDELESGVILPANTATIEWGRARVATTERSFRFRFYLGLGCGWKTSWLRAAQAGDTAGQQAAVDGVESIAAALADRADVTPDEYTDLARWMRTGDAEQVATFGSNDCPTWSASIG